jgi:ubiquinone/menaquinone biosynthesis C-methylase UbiE
MIASIKQIFTTSRAGQSPREAYNTWATSYDTQPGNLMLDLDELVFSDLLKSVAVSGKKIADIGCGTGRHWKKIYDKNPALLTGFDVSTGMLAELSRKYPAAVVHEITNNRFKNVPDATFDCLVSTLTIAHIRDIDEAIAAWSRILKRRGYVIITDFHPSLLQKGGRRSFNHAGKTVTVKNYTHPLTEVQRIFKKYGCTVQGLVEKYIDQNVRHYYEAKNALAVYERFKGEPVIYGLILQKEYEAE